MIREFQFKNIYISYTILKTKGCKRCIYTDFLKNFRILFRGGINAIQ